MDMFVEVRELPEKLSRELQRYDRRCERFLKEDQQEQDRIDEEYHTQQINAERKRDASRKETEARWNKWDAELKQAGTVLIGVDTKARSICAQAQLPLEGSGTMQQIGEALVAETKRRVQDRWEDDNEELIQLCAEENRLRHEIDQTMESIRTGSEGQREREKAAADQTFQMEVSYYQNQREVGESILRRRTMLRSEQERNALTERVERLLLPDAVKELVSQIDYSCPGYDLFEPAEEFPAGIRFGSLGYEVTEHLSDPVKEAVLKNRFGFAVREENGRTYLKLPYGFSLTDRRFSTMFEFTKENQKQAGAQVRDLALNLFLSIPVNKCWCTMIDPENLGGNFALFAPMGEKDQEGKGDPRSIDTRTWTTEKDIEDRLELIVSHTTDVIRRCLQGKYKNILEYNQQAGINAEPLRFIVVMDFPKNFTERSLNLLGTLLDNGPKTGVYTLVAANAEEMDQWPEQSTVDKIRRHFNNRIVSENGVFYIQDDVREGKLRFFPIDSPGPLQYQDLISGVKEHLGEEIVITYPMISDDLPSRPDYWFKKSALNGISVPIGMEGAGKIVNLEFGHPYHTFAALIAGTTGAGKTSLFHTIIQSVLMNYSTEDVQLYLLDFKKGVEFKCYADYGLPNFRVISVETEPEFALAVLNALSNELNERSKKFRETGTRSIEDYWQYRGRRGESHGDMPRLLVIFDEVEALLRDDQDVVQKKCCSIIHEIVSQGARAFGMHLILATQTFEHVKGLDNVYGNMHTRIVLKTTEESVNLLLKSDDNIAERLSEVDPGQGVFNNNGGNKNANRMFRAAMIRDEERDQWMLQVRDAQLQYLTQELPKSRILLSGPQDDRDNPLTVFSVSAQVPSKLGDPSYHLYIGESLTIENNYYPSLWNARGQNLLIAGKNEDNTDLSRMITGYSVMSLLMETIRLEGRITAPFITVFDLNDTYASAGDKSDMLTRIETMVPEAFRIIPRNQILNGIQTLARELPEGRQQFVVFYGLNRAKQLTTGTYERSPKELLIQLFAQGPENGMNFIVWANNPGSFLENYAMALQFFDNRLAYGMEDKEFKQITGEPGPSYNTGMNAICYNAYGDNQKIRMYGQPTEDWLDQFLMNIRLYLG